MRETILFSARLRLDPELVGNDEDVEAFADQVLVSDSRGPGLFLESILTSAMSFEERR